MRRLARFVAVMAVMALGATKADAQILLAETFTYPDGALTNVSAGGSITWTAFSGSGTAPLNVTNGQAITSGRLSQDVGATLPTPGASNGVIAASFDVNIASWPTGAGAYFAMFKDDTTSHFRARVMVTNDSGSVRIGIANAASATAAAGVAFEATTLSFGTTYKIVIRYDQSGAAPVATLWVNPMSPTDPSVSASDVVGTPRFIPITQFALRQSNSQQGIATVDNLLIEPGFCNYYLASYTLSTSVLPPGGGTTIGDGTYTRSCVEVNATPSPCYSFVSWTDENGAVICTSATCTFDLDARNRNIVANFVFGAIDPTNASYGAQPTNGTISVTASNGCTWTATNDVDWLTITSGANGTGSGSVCYSVAPNSAYGTRTGTLTVAGSLFTVVQSGGYDSVGDGIPDWWRQLYFGDGSTTDCLSCATCDADGDGLTDLQEFFTGTDPTSSASTFRITSITRDGDDLHITWTSAPNKTNAVQVSTGGAGGGYINGFIDGPMVLTGNQTNITFIDLGAATNLPSRYYRVRLVL